MDWGKADLAAHYLADALAIARRLFGDEDVEVAHVLKAIGEAALQRHDCKQAIVHEQTALALFKKKIGAEGAFQADTLRLLGDAYLHCGQPVQAVEVLGRAAQMYQGLSPSPDSPDLLRTRALLTKAQAARHGSEKRTK
jgi:tetratricopeptide (TPR) repeat protein